MVFPSPRLKSAYQLFSGIKGKLDTNHTGKKYLMTSYGVFQKSACVLNIKTTLDTNSNIKTNGMEVYVSGIRGQGVRGIVPPAGI